MPLFLILQFSLACFAAPHATPPHWDKIVIASSRWALDPHLVEAIIWVESHASPSAISPKGAMGLMQVMPGTARHANIHAPLNPIDNLLGACRYLRELMNRYRANLTWVLAAYNAGPAAVDRFKGIPPYQETQRYVTAVLKRYEEFKPR